MVGQSVSSKVLLQEYWEAIRQTPQIFKRTAFRRRTLEEELQEVGSPSGTSAAQRASLCGTDGSAGCASTILQALLRGSLRKAFGGLDLWLLGLGIVIASGWAQLTGTAAQEYAG